MITEIAIAQAVAEGTLPSPTPWLNAVYVALRLSRNRCCVARQRRRIHIS